MARHEIKTLRRAAALAGVSHEAVREWCERHGIGSKQEDGTWVIDRRKLMRLVRARKVLGL